MRYILILLLAVSNLALAGQHRSASAKYQFQKAHPCPSTGKAKGACPGWVKDHVIALECGGYDAPSNMQWQTVADSKTKDKWERKGCKK